MEYLILNRKKAKKYSFQKHNKTSIIISINDVNKYPIKFYNNFSFNKILSISYYTFDDVEINENNCITDVDANNIVNFVKKWYDKCEIIIINCEVGQSRSAGICAAIMNYFEGNDQSIFNNPNYTPNMTCYKKILNILYEKRC